MSATTSTDTVPRTSGELLADAVHRFPALTSEGLSERLFTIAFSSLVYPQIWEDPLIDLEALELGPGHRLIAIASGGCNVMSYLTAGPAHITAVDLNAAHIALNRLKIAAATFLPSHDEFYRFFGEADARENVVAFDRQIAPFLDADTLRYWTGRDLRGRRRIERFADGFYRYGLLGRFIATGHRLARLFGRDPRKLLAARSREEQIAIYESELAPLFKRPLVRHLLDRPSSLFGLGIPPAQYEHLANGRPMHEVIEERLRRLATGFDLSENYFAWQAFARAYAPGGQGPLPPYLEKKNHVAVSSMAHRIDVVHASFTDVLASSPANGLDRYVLLDAQDWMEPASLNQLWREITRTARPGARVIFRSAAEETPLTGRVSRSLLDRWTYEAGRSRAWTLRDRSAIYGGFHLYVLKD